MELWGVRQGPGHLRHCGLRLDAVEVSDAGQGVGYDDESSDDGGWPRLVQEDGGAVAAAPMRSPSTRSGAVFGRSWRTIARPAAGGHCR
jgi:hypothetical protein